MNPHLGHTLADRRTVTEVSGFRALDPDNDLGLGPDISEALQPIVEGV